MHPPTALQVFANFLPKKATTLYHPLYSQDLSLPDYFLFPKVKMKLKGLQFADVAEIQEAVTDELKKVQKNEFLAAFQKLYDRAKVDIYIYIYASGAYFELKKSYVSSIFKKISLKTFGPQCVDTCLVSTGITNSWSTQLGRPLLCHCFLHFLPTASTMACLLPFPDRHNFSTPTSL